MGIKGSLRAQSKLVGLDSVFAIFGCRTSVFLIYLLIDGCEVRKANLSIHLIESSFNVFRKAERRILFQEDCQLEFDPSKPSRRNTSVTQRNA